MNEYFTVYLVDDDPGVLKALARLLSANGYQTRAFSSPREFLDQHDPAVPGCAVFDVSMPDLNGLELQQALSLSGTQRPIVFLTGQGDIPTSVRAMKAGAVDFLTKPIDDKDLFAAIAAAQAEDSKAREAQSALAAIHAQLAQLTPRERQVLSHVIKGRLNKQIAADLGTVEKTIKVHRSRMMSKLGVRTVAELMRFVQQAGTCCE